MPRSSKSSKSQSSKSSQKKHSAVPPKGGVAEVPAVEAKKPVNIAIPAPAAKAPEKASETVKHVEAPKTAATVAAPVAASHTAHSDSAHSHSTGPSAAIQSQLNDLQSNSAGTRLTAATEIGRTGDRHAVPALIQALRDTDADVAREAATSLGHLGDRSAVDALVDVLSDTNGYFHSVVRAAAASSLGQLKDTRAVESLLTALTDPIAESSAEAIRALAVLNDRRAVSPLIDVVRNRSGFFVTSVRRAAVLALAHFGGEEAIEQLRFVAADEWEDNVIRDEAQTAVRNANA